MTRRSLLKALAASPFAFLLPGSLLAEPPQKRQGSIGSSRDGLIEDNHAVEPSTRVLGFSFLLKPGDIGESTVWVASPPGQTVSYVPSSRLITWFSTVMSVGFPNAEIDYKRQVEFLLLNKDGTAWAMPPGTKMSDAPVTTASENIFRDKRYGVIERAVRLRRHEGRSLLGAAQIQAALDQGNVNDLLAAYPKESPPNPPLADLHRIVVLVPVQAAVAWA